MVDDEKPIRFGRSRRRRAEMEPGQRTKEKKTEKTDAVCGKGRNECVLESDRPFYLTFGLRHTHTHRKREREDVRNLIVPWGLRRTAHNGSCWPLE